MSRIDSYWQTFLTETGRDSSLRYASAFHFELTAEWADKLLDLVVRGEKRATCSSIPACYAEIGRLPEAGDLHIITDGNNNPACVIETTSVTVIPFNEMTFDLCRLEGEDDDLASWKQGHRRFFTAEGAATGYVFAEEMPVVFETFRLLHMAPTESEGL